MLSRIGSREGKFFSRGLEFGFLTEKEDLKNSQIVFRGLQDASFYHHAENAAPLELAKHEEVQKPNTPANVQGVRTVEIVVWPFATISLNGNVIAKNSKSVTLKLEHGTHKLAFTHTYAATVEKLIRVTEGTTPLEIRVSLDKSKPAFLVVRSNVDSDVAVDGSYRGTTKKSQTRPIVIPMPDKSHAQTKEVIVSQENYAPFILETEFVAGQTKEIDVKLKPFEGGTNTIDKEPSPTIKKLY